MPIWDRFHAEPIHGCARNAIEAILTSLRNHDVALATEDLRVEIRQSAT